MRTKIKFLYLKSPNPVGGITGKDCVISFMTSLPKEFDLKNYIDYDTQFEKAFLDPLKSIVDAYWVADGRTKHFGITICIRRIHNGLS